MSIEPSAMPAMRPVSSAPKTRPRTASGVRRCRIVEALTSTIGLAKPMIAMARNARRGLRQRGDEQQRQRPEDDADPKSVASLRAVARPMATKPPRIAPTPNALSR